MSADGLEQSVEKMRREGLPDVAIDTFSHYYRLLESGQTGMLAESEIEPLGEVQAAEDLQDPGPGAREALDRTVVVKLNGGLGTSMGMSGPKSLLDAKDGLTFLDIVARQVIEARRRFSARVPLVLMNSFATRDATLEALGRHPEIAADVPLDFVQSKVPKLLAGELAPASWPDNPQLEWAPPGHGDIYTSLVSSGMLAELLDRGYEYAFLSNVDNLGAVLDARILAWFARERLPFASEVTDRTESDRKGGHLARLDGGGLVLRETAQTPDSDLDAFQDVARHRFFNVNNLWVNLPALERLIDERGGVLGLPMIANRKTVDPSDSSSPAVIQLETAMGAAIAVFDGAQVVHVPRRRFAPVKTTDDLLVLRSDAYRLTEHAEVELAPQRGATPPFVALDSRYYKLIDDFDARFPAGAPSLVDCERFEVEGDVRFGRGVEAHGEVRVVNDGDAQLAIADGTVLRDA